MNWDAIGAAGEILGAAAVIGTLFYLAQQIRQNTQSMKSRVRESVTVSLTDPFLEQASSAIPLLYVKAASDPNELTDEEAAQFGFFVGTYIKRLEHAYHQYLEENLDDRSWEALEKAALAQF